MRILLITLILTLLRFPLESQNIQRDIDSLNIKRDNVNLFLQDNYQHALDARSSHGIPVSLFLAQMALESGWSSSRRSREDCNFFGIKINHEYVVFNTKQDCIDVYLKTLSNDCYLNLVTDTLDDWFEALECCKYAKSEQYCCKLMDIIEDFKLYKLD